MQSFSIEEPLSRVNSITSAIEGKKYEKELNRIAVLVCDASGDLQAEVKKACATKRLGICVEAKIRARDRDCSIYIVRIDDPSIDDTIAHEMREACVMFDGLLEEDSADTFLDIWAVHGSEASRFEFLDVENHGISIAKSKRASLLNWLHMVAPHGGRPFLRMLRDVYGANVAYSCAQASFFLQKLWYLLFLGIAFIMCGDPSTMSGTHRVIWESSKVGLLLWGLWIVIDGRKQERILAKQTNDYHHQPLNNRRYRQQKDKARCRRMVLHVWPLRIFLLTLCCALLLAQVQLDAWLVFVWGDCLNLGCTEPDKGWIGTLYVNASSTFLGYIFIVIKMLSGKMGKKVADVKNARLLDDYRHDLSKDALYASGLAKIGSFVLLALIFVPQWRSDPGADPDFDCSNVIGYKWLGNSSIFCLQQRVSLQQRQSVFSDSMQGPFVTAPFTEVLMQALVPFFMLKATSKLHADAGKAENELTECEAQIVARGAAHEFESAEDMLSEALAQHKLQRYSAFDELLEQKLAFLCLIFFLPVKPEMIVTWLLSRILDAHSDVLKLLMLQQRPVPNSAEVTHKMHERFLAYALIFAAVWSLLLSVLTYNRSLGELWS
eukprot:TRINITY_DN26726_c0_g1_i1.p1 TRINITY_DN26726_c0_g1~~TRINITY_DN26726_c0_g1_i1.p1  ORF type:complete len:619 (-),score=98.71 TRINITY_DN26726_c0_g1_i1:201-2018(-)